MLNNKALLMLALGMGASAMYMLDPERGRRRRALVRDRIRHGGNLIEGAGTRMAGYTHDLRNRARGVMAETRSHLRRDHADDSVIEARVRSQLGRNVEASEALAVSVYEGKVTLRGTLAGDAADRALATARGVRGVTDVESLLQTDA